MIEKYSLPVSGPEKKVLFFVSGSFENKSSAVKGFFSSDSRPVSTPAGEASVAFGCSKTTEIGLRGTPAALPASSHIFMKEAGLWRKIVRV